MNILYFEYLRFAWGKKKNSWQSESSATPPIGNKEMVRKFRVLYVDGDVNAKEASVLLERLTENASVITVFTVAPNTFTALDYSESTCFDMIMVKKGFRQLDACHMLGILRNVGAPMPIVLILEQNDRMKEEDVLKQGFYCSLRKDFTATKLIAIIERAVQDQNALRMNIQNSLIQANEERSDSNPSSSSDTTRAEEDNQVQNDTNQQDENRITITLGNENANISQNSSNNSEISDANLSLNSISSQVHAQGMEIDDSDDISTHLITCAAVNEHNSIGISEDLLHIADARRCNDSNSSMNNENFEVSTTGSENTDIEPYAEWVDRRIQQRQELTSTDTTYSDAPPPSLQYQESIQFSSSYPNYRTSANHALAGNDTTMSINAAQARKSILTDVIAACWSSEVATQTNTISGSGSSQHASLMTMDLTASKDASSRRRRGRPPTTSQAPNAKRACPISKIQVFKGLQPLAEDEGESENESAVQRDPVEIQGSKSSQFHILNQYSFSLSEFKQVGITSKQPEQRSR